MKQTRISLVGFLLSFSAIHLPTTSAQATPSESPPPPTIEARLSQLTNLVRQCEQQLPEADRFSDEQVLAKGFADGHDAGWRRSSHSGWADGRHGGEFRNSNPWRDGWRDGRRFFDWPND